MISSQRDFSFRDLFLHVTTGGNAALFLISGAGSRGVLVPTLYWERGFLVRDVFGENKQPNTEIT